MRMRTKIEIACNDSGGVARHLPTKRGGEPSETTAACVESALQKRLWYISSSHNLCRIYKRL